MHKRDCSLLHFNFFEVKMSEYDEIIHRSKILFHRTSIADRHYCKGPKQKIFINSHIKIHHLKCDVRIFEKFVSL